MNQNHQGQGKVGDRNEKPLEQLEQISGLKSVSIKFLWTPYEHGPYRVGKLKPLLSECCVYHQFRTFILVSNELWNYLVKNSFEVVHTVTFDKKLLAFEL